MGHGLKPLRIRLSLQRSERLGGGIAELDSMRGEAVQAISVAAVAARAEIALLPHLLLDGGALFLDLLLDLSSRLRFLAFPWCDAGRWLAQHARLRHPRDAGRGLAQHALLLPTLEI